MSEQTEAETVANLALATVEPQALDPEELYLAIVPPGSTAQVLDLEKHAATPARVKGTVHLHEAASLSAYVLAHRASGTAMYADVLQRRIVAVVDHHEGTTPAWGGHKAVLSLRHTPEWEHWIKLDRKLGDQQTFAAHIEEGLAEIVDPAAADMLELAQSFQAATSVNFRSSQLLDSGQTQIAYEESIDAKAGQRGQLTIPKEFVLGVAPFEGGESYRVVARLRYRIREGALSIGYSLDRPEDVIRSAFGALLERVESSTGLTAYRGTPLSASS